MNCQEFDNLIVDYLDGSLPKKEQRACRQHVRQCPACRSAALKYRHIVKKLQQLPPVRCPDTVVNAVFEALPVPGRRFSFLEQMFRNMYWKVSFAATLALLIISLVLFSPHVRNNRVTDEIYTAEEIKQAQKDVALAFQYFHEYMNKTEAVIEKQVLDQALIKPMKSTMKIALKPLIDGGNR